MKKIIGAFLIFCIAFFPGCTSASPDRDPGNSAGLIPANVRSISITYQSKNLDTWETETKSYQADYWQFLDFCDFINSAELLKMTENDTFSFSNIVYINAADISVRFDTGESLYIYGEGGISRFMDENRTGLPTPECYFISQDSIHQIKKILIPDFEKDYTFIREMDSEYVREEDINGNKADEISVYLPQERSMFPVSDGFIALHQVWGGSEEDSFLRAVKYDKRGNFLWLQNHTEIKGTLSYGLNNFIQTRDGGFVFSICGSVSWVFIDPTAEESESVANIIPGWLVKCDKDGKILWQEQLEFLGESQISFICETPDGSILTVGTCQTDDDHYKKGDPSYSYTDLLLMKYDSTGKRVKLKKYGGSDFDSFRNACYDPDVGFVVLGSTQSCDGDITKREEKGSGLYPRELLVVLDDNLNEQWQYVFEGSEEIHWAYAAVVDGQIFVAGSLSGDSGKNNQSAVFKFSAQGIILNSISINSQLAGGIQVSKDQTLLLLLNGFGDESVAPDYSLHHNWTHTESKVYRLSQNLETLKIVQTAVGSEYYDRIVPTGDNGFFIVQKQAAAYLPQPSWMDMDRIDLATVLCRYNADGNLVLRKTYHKNRQAKADDTVIPLPDGRVIVGR